MSYRQVTMMIDEYILKTKDSDVQLALYLHTSVIPLTSLFYQDFFSSSDTLMH